MKGNKLATGIAYAILIIVMVDIMLLAGVGCAALVELLMMFVRG